MKDAVRRVDRRSCGDGLIICGDGAARFLNHHRISGQGYEHGSVDQLGQHQLLPHEVREEDNLHKMGDNRQSPEMAGTVEKRAFWRLSSFDLWFPWLTLFTQTKGRRERTGVFRDDPEGEKQCCSIR